MIDRFAQRKCFTIADILPSNLAQAYRRRSLAMWKMRRAEEDLSPQPSVLVIGRWHRLGRIEQWLDGHADHAACRAI
jgi:hypothetical protein